MSKNFSIIRKSVKSLRLGVPSQRLTTEEDIKLCAQCSTKKRNGHEIPFIPARVQWKPMGLADDEKQSQNKQR